MLFMVSMLSIAFADLPLPVYPNCGEADAEDLCPNDADDWNVLSYIPADQQTNIQDAKHCNKCFLVICKSLAKITRFRAWICAHITIRRLSLITDVSNVPHIVLTMSVLIQTH